MPRNSLSQDRALSRDRIIREALALVDAHGIDALTMRRLGHVLNVDPMAIYRHVPNKAALLSGIAEYLWIAGLDVEHNNTLSDWKTVLSDAMNSFRQLLLAHPNAILLVANHPWTTEQELDLLERSLQALTTAGMTNDVDALGLFNAVGVFTIGFVLAETVAPVDPISQPTLQDLRKRSDTRPNLAQAIARAQKPDQNFQRGLAALINGWRPASASH